jgi:hypothetical protein
MCIADKGKYKNGNQSNNNSSKSEESVVETARGLVTASVLELQEDANEHIEIYQPHSIKDTSEFPSSDHCFLEIV